MAEVHFRPEVEISIPDAAFHHARRIMCGYGGKECNCECHFTYTKTCEDLISCNCRYKGNGEYLLRQYNRSDNET